MPQRKFYVVWKGLKPGVYDNWKECEAHIRGVEGAVYKSFAGREEAENAYRSDWRNYITKKKKVIQAGGNYIAVSISVDAACSGNPGIMEYRGVNTSTREELFHQGPFPLGTNNIGEFLGIVHALAMLKKSGSDIPVYSDSRTAIKWVTDCAVKTKLERNVKTEPLFSLVDRAVAWLKNNDYRNPLLKWKTEEWGEIPADFGRK